MTNSERVSIQLKHHQLSVKILNYVALAFEQKLIEINVKTNCTYRKDHVIHYRW